MQKPKAKHRQRKEPDPSKRWTLAAGRRPKLAGVPAQGQPPWQEVPPLRGPSEAATTKLSDLPKGVEWPQDPKAKQVVVSLFCDMCASRARPLEQRRRAYKALCLSWHPDKNPKHQALATAVFVFLQSLKQWYL